MPNRRKLFQISLITLGLIIVFLTYFTNLERNQPEDFKVSENISKSPWEGNYSFFLNDVVVIKCSSN